MKYSYRVGRIMGSCDPGYVSPFGGQELVIMCVDGEWEQLPWPDPSNPSCLPLCSPMCRAGQCVAPNTCKCPYGLSGSLCEVAAGCSKPPLIPHHAQFFMGWVLFLGSLLVWLFFSVVFICWVIHIGILHFILPSIYLIYFPLFTVFNIFSYFSYFPSLSLFNYLISSI